MREYAVLVNDLLNNMTWGDLHTHREWRPIVRQHPHHRRAANMLQLVIDLDSEGFPGNHVHMYHMLMSLGVGSIPQGWGRVGTKSACACFRGDL